MKKSVLLICMVLGMYATLFAQETEGRLSLVINGKMMNEAIVSGVNNLLGINLVAVPADK